MYPQAELDNYKLQVELLQEKLQRSEDNRQQLEHKLDKVLQKRSELEKCVRHKSRQKYQEFLEEQSQRNERNKKLVQMLERIDEQTAAMSQRSERLKMMKLQYQMYFAKLVQNQTLRCIQQTTATGGNGLQIPVMLQPQATAVQPAAAAAAAAAATAGATTAPAASLNSNPIQPLHNPMAAATPQQWAFATPTQMPLHLPMGMSMPMPGGMLLAPQYMPHPAYMPMQDLYGVGGAGMGGAQPLGTSNLFDLRATLRALDNENAELPERMTHFDAGALAAAQYPKVSTDRTTPTPAATATATTLASPCSEQDKYARRLSSTSSTLATSSLTFDKLPKTATLTELPTAAATGAVAGIDDVGVGRPQVAAKLRRGSHQAWEQEPETEAWPNSRVTKVEHEKSPSVAAHNEPAQQQQRQQQQQQQQQQRQQQPHNFDAYFGELKIDEPWQPATTLTTKPRDQFEDKLELNVRASELKAVGVGVIGGISNELLDEVKASRAALQKAAAAVDEQLARGNQLSPTATNEPAAKPRVSIENIENAIYGERLTAAETAATAAAAAAAAAGAIPAQGLFENLVANAPESKQLEVEQESGMEIEALPEQHQQHQQQQRATRDVAQIDYAQYDANSYGDPGEPSYASIESSQQPQQQPQQQQQQQPSVLAEPLYSEIGNPTDYQQYATDANGATEVETEAAAQQEYSNMDYSNYDASQYAAGYDPNAYPGYIYDETTGQYIADPIAAQYAPDGSYAGQEYDAGATNYDYYAEQQQEQHQEQQEAAYPMADSNSEAAVDLFLPQEVEHSTPLDAADAKTEAVHSPAPPSINVKPVKPTSILASTDKQAAPNDAQQQQQQHPQQQQQQQQQKKKKRVNFVDSSETDDSSSAKPAQDTTSATSPSVTPSAVAAVAATPANAAAAAAAASESDFDFSTGSEAKN